MKRAGASVHTLPVKQQCRQLSNSIVEGLGWCCFGIMESNMETRIVYWGYVDIIEVETTLAASETRTTQTQSPKLQVYGPKETFDEEAFRNEVEDASQEAPHVH